MLDRDLAAGIIAGRTVDIADILGTYDEELDGSDCATIIAAMLVDAALYNATGYGVQNPVYRMSQSVYGSRHEDYLKDGLMEIRLRYWPGYKEGLKAAASEDEKKALVDKAGYDNRYYDVVDVLSNIMVSASPNIICLDNDSKRRLELRKYEREMRLRLADTSAYRSGWGGGFDYLGRQVKPNCGLRKDMIETVRSYADDIADVLQVRIPSFSDSRERIRTERVLAYILTDIITDRASGSKIFSDASEKLWKAPLLNLPGAHEVEYKIFRNKERLWTRRIGNYLNDPLSDTRENVLLNCLIHGDIASYRRDVQDYERLKRISKGLETKRERNKKMPYISGELLTKPRRGAYERV